MRVAPSNSCLFVMSALIKTALLISKLLSSFFSNLIPDSSDKSTIAIPLKI